MLEAYLTIENLDWPTNLKLGGNWQIFTFFLITISTVTESKVIFYLKGIHLRIHRHVLYLALIFYLSFHCEKITKIGRDKVAKQILWELFAKILRETKVKVAIVSALRTSIFHLLFRQSPVRIEGVSILLFFADFLINNLSLWIK